MLLGWLRHRVIFDAKGTSRRLRVTDDGIMMINVRPLAWWWMNERRTEGRDPSVEFTLGAIASGWYRPATRWRRGTLQLNVPSANDPWQRRSDAQRLARKMPKPRPHRIRFTRRQQPAFALCAYQIGLPPC